MKGCLKMIVRMVSALLFLMFGLTSCTSGDDQIKAIRERGVLRVGVKVDVPRFGYMNPDTGRIEGMEVDLAHTIAKNIMRDENAVKLVNVTAQTRGPMLDNGEIDIVIATFTITEERRKSFNFSRPYYTDELGYLVSRSASLKRPEDLNGKNVGVARAGTAKTAIEDECARLGIDVTISEYSSYPEVKAALAGGDVDAFVADKSILYGYLDGDSALLDAGFNPQHYGIACTLKNDRLSAYIDSLLETWEKNGELAAIYGKWEI